MGLHCPTDMKAVEGGRACSWPHWEQKAEARLEARAASPVPASSPRLTEVGEGKTADTSHLMTVSLSLPWIQSQRGGLGKSGGCKAAR